MVIIAYEHPFGNQCDAGGEPPRPFLSPVGMRCLPDCSGAGEPTPVGANLQSWPSGPMSGRPYFLCSAAFNQPFLRHFARIALRPLPGDGLSHPEQRGRQRIKPSASFGCSVTAESLRSQIALPRWRIELAWDCTPAPTGVGSPAPEQSGRQRIKPSASFGSSVTLVGKLHSFGAGFFPSHRLARKGREGL